MKFIFWENIISHLRVPFYKELLKNHEVLLIVDKELTEDRKKLGWKTQKIEGLEVIVNPNNGKILEIIEANKEAHHFLAGINVYDAPTKALNLLKAENIKFSILSEQYKKQGLKGYLRGIKSKIQYLKYKNDIKGIYAIGNDAVDWYLKSGYDKKIVHQWIYFSEFFNIQRTQSQKDIVLFVGALSDRKNILFLIDSFLKLDKSNAILKIIGGGEHKDKVLDQVQKHPKKIEYLAVLPTLEARKHMAEAKILVLPSVFDGWGAVVNEALLCGTYCITSNNCGSKTLFKNPMLGSTFRLEDQSDLKIVLQKTLDNLDTINNEEIKKWANDKLEHSKAINYFIQTINDNIGKPQAPWV